MRQLVGQLLMVAWRRRAAVLTLAALAWLVWMAAAPGSLQRLDERTTDYVWQMTANDTVERRVILLDIDDQSLARIGPWPWPRATMARLARELDAQGAGLKLFDVVFPDPREGDADLTQALGARDAQAPSVLAQVFALRHESQLRSGVLAGAVPGVGCQAPTMPAQGFIANVAGLHPRAGHITPTLDPDGAVRRLPGFVCLDDHTYPTMTLAGLMALAASDGSPVRLIPGTGPFDPEWRLDLSSLGVGAVPMDGEGQIRVPFSTARQAITSLPAADLLQGKVPAGMLKGAWVIVGSSAFGLGDVVPTALGGAVGGAEVHAQLLLGVLDNAVPYAPRAAIWLQLVYVVLAVGALLVLAAGKPLRERRAVLLLPLLAAILSALAFVLHAVLLTRANWYVGWSSAGLAIGLSGLALALGEHARSMAEKGRLFRNLSSYMPSQVAEQIALTEPTGDIEARRSDLTVLVADLQNFSRYCEARPPEDAARVLHRFLSTAETVIQGHGGVVEEMVGDRILGVFNGPLACEEHPVQALLAARELWLRCNEDLPNTASIGLEPLSVSIGLETGMALMGSFGPARRRVHTVMGQTVTTALRLQTLTADLAYPILVGQTTARRVGLSEQPHLALKPLGSFLLPGLQRARTVFTLRTLLEPGSVAEQSTLHYLFEKQNSVV